MSLAFPRFICRSVALALFSAGPGVPCLAAKEKATPPPEKIAETDETGQPESGPIGSAQMQRMVMDFSDQFVSGLWLVFDKYLENETDLTKRVKAQKWKVMLGATSMTIAGSQDPRSALLDMAVFISAGKWAVDHHWIPKVFGDEASGLRGFYKEMNQQIWVDVAKVLTPAQQSDLRSLIEGWEETDPPPSELLDVRLRNLDGVVLTHFAETASSRGLMASIQRLLGKVDQSLLYGERVIFYMERMPRIMAQQSDLTIDRVAERFPIATANPDFSSLSAMANDLPQRIETLLQDPTSGIAKAVPDVRASIESVERMTLSLQKTLDSANLLAGKVEKLPFEPGDYTSAMHDTSVSLTQLNQVIMGLNQLLDSETNGEPKPIQLARLLDDSTNRLADKAFNRGLILLGVFFAGVLLSLVAAKRLFWRKA